MTHQEILNRVCWKDLTKLTKWECFVEGNVTVPWLSTSLILAWYELYWLALPFSFYYFLAGLRQVHNGFHNSLGVGKRVVWFVLFTNSVLMLASMHAVKFNHLRHHKYCLEENDYEGKVAKLKWLHALLYGPIHLFLIHYHTFRIGNKSYRRNVSIELIAITIFVSITWYFQIHFLMYHTIAMITGELLSAFFAVWTVHHDAEDLFMQTRTQRTKWKNRVTLNMFYHLEHHMFPAVPAIKLPQLATRLDQAIPEIKKKSTF